MLRSWVNYRKRVPGGKKTSPLDHLHVDTWDPAWTTELVDLLTVLTRLVALEEEQAALLADVLAGPLVARSQLTEAGVAWPASSKDRRPQYDPAPSTEEGQLDLGV